MAKQIFSLLLFLLCGTFYAPMAQAAGALEVVCGIAPYTYLAERIGGSHVSVRTLVEQNQDPHTFEPSPRHVAALGRARIFFLSGLDFEERLSSKLRQSFPALIFVDLSQGLEPGSGAQECGQAEQHEAHCDQHLWLSPPLYRAQAESVAHALANEDPVHKNDYYKNLATFQQELDSLAARIAKQLQPFQGRSFFVFHPAFAYFGEAFGLHQKAVEVGGRAPTPKTIANLIAAAREAGVRIIFVQPQFDQTSAKIVAAAIGGTVVGLDPLAKDVLHNYTVIAEQLERAFQ